MKNFTKTGKRPDSGGNKYLSRTESNSSPGNLGELDFEKVNSEMYVSQKILIKKKELEKKFNGKKKLNFDKKHNQEVVAPKVEVVNVAILKTEESKLKYSLSPFSERGDLLDSTPKNIPPEKIVSGLTQGRPMSAQVQQSPSEKVFMVSEQPSIGHVQDIARHDSGLQPSPSNPTSFDKEISMPTQIQPIRGISPIESGQRFGGSDQSDITLPFPTTNREQDVLLETPANTTKAPTRTGTSYYVEHPSFQAQHEPLGLPPSDQTPKAPQIQHKVDSPIKEIFDMPPMPEEEALGLTERRLEN